MTFEHLQSFFRSAGENCCYATTLMKLGENILGRELTLSEIGSVMDRSILMGYIYFNKENYLDKDNFTVKSPEKVLSLVTGKTYSVRKESADYKCRKGEHEVLFMALSMENGKKGIGHFVLKDFDPIQGSNTKKNGIVYSKRIFREIQC